MADSKRWGSGTALVTSVQIAGWTNAHLESKTNESQKASTHLPLLKLRQNFVFGESKSNLIQSTIP